MMKWKKQRKKGRTIIAQADTSSDLYFELQQWLHYEVDFPAIGALDALRVLRLQKSSFEPLSL